jgi:hypothetical protein
MVYFFLLKNTKIYHLFFSKLKLNQFSCCIILFQNGNIYLNKQNIRSILSKPIVNYA